MYTLPFTVLLPGTIQPLAIFCAPVLGIWEAVTMAVVGVVLFGVPLLSILRRIQRQEERMEIQRRKTAGPASHPRNAGNSTPIASRAPGNAKKS